MDYCSSPPAYRIRQLTEQAGLRGVLTCAFHVGVGCQSHSRGKTPPEEIQAGDFPQSGAFGRTLFPDEKCQAGASGLMITSNFINAPLSSPSAIAERSCTSPFKGGLRDIQLETSRGYNL